MLPQKKEREYRFKLALRMVLPIFALVIALVIHTFITSSKAVTTSFYIESLLILLFSTYFIFYLIYKGFDNKITDNISKIFTRDHLYRYLEKEINNAKDYTLIFFSIDNLYDINKRYGLNSGDRVIYETVKWVEDYLTLKGITNFPIGHLSGSSFIIGLKGEKNRYKSALELLCLKGEEFKVDDIEVQFSGAINDTSFSRELDFLIENLLEIQNRNKEHKGIVDSDEEIDPNELEYEVITAFKERSFEILTQDVFDNDVALFKECLVKLKTKEGKILHQKNYMKILDKFMLMGEYDVMNLETVTGMCIRSQEQKYAISISPTSLRKKTVLSKIKEILQKAKLEKGRIILLIKESEYYSRIEKFNSILKELRELGVLICIDRLGSIHTSFLYLRDLDVDIVRLDSFYTKDIDKKRHFNIIKGFIVMAHEKEVKTWIRMVENKETYDMSKELEIDYIQGKYLSKIEKNQIYGE